MAGSVKIAAYDRQELIGEGGAAYVYKMRHRGGQMYAALKVLKESAHPDFRRRFADEMNIGRLLKHPYIVTVYDTGEIDGMNFILMEYLEGRSLRDRLNRPVNVATATAIIGQIGQALDYATLAVCFIAISSRRTSSSPPTMWPSWPTSALPNSTVCAG